MTNRKRFLKGDRFEIKGVDGVFNYVPDPGGVDVFDELARFWTAASKPHYECMVTVGVKTFVCSRSFMGKQFLVKVPYKSLSFENLIYDPD